MIRMDNSNAANDLESAASAFRAHRLTGIHSTPPDHCPGSRRAHCLQSRTGRRDASTGPVTILELEVRFDGVSDPIAILGRGLADDLAGKPKHERVGRDLHPLATHRAGANDRAASDAHTVEQHGAHRDQTIVVDDGPVHDCTMTNRDALADHGGKIVVDVHDRSILHVAIVADRDRGAVAAEDGGGPDRHARTDRDVTGDDRGGMNESGRVDVHVRAGSASARETGN